jgi:peroxiredoxin Q/BCP
MAQLRQTFKEFSNLNTDIVVVGPDNEAAFNEYWKTHQLPFMGLPDPKAETLKRYGQEVNLFKLGRMPAQVLVDKQGIARFAHYGHSMSDIPESREIIELIKTFNKNN